LCNSQFIELQNRIEPITPTTKNPTTASPTMSPVLVDLLTRVLGASGAGEFVGKFSFFERSAGAAGSEKITGSAVPREARTKRAMRRVSFILDLGVF
jgi:hypothetical protein